MNGYQLQAEGYKQYLVKNPDVPNKESLERIVKVNKILGDCSQEEIYELYNSSAFNDLTKAYCKKALENVGIPKEQIEAILSELYWLHDTLSAEEIMK